jgi:hypothetical protein
MLALDAIVGCSLTIGTIAVRTHVIRRIAVLHRIISQCNEIILATGQVCNWKTRDSPPVNHDHDGSTCT